MCRLESAGRKEAGFPLPQSFLFNPPTDWARPTHIMKGKAICFHLKFSFMVTARLVFEQTTGSHGLDKGTEVITTEGTEV